MKEISSHKLPPTAGHQNRQWGPIALAALVHVLLLVFLWVGVQWQSKESTAVEAEIWDMTTREAAPKSVPPPEPEPVTALPEPEKITPPVVAPVKPVPKLEPLEDPEIALAQEKKRKRLEKAKQEEELKLEREKALKLEQEKEKELEKAKDKAKEKEKEREKLAEQKKKAEKAEQDEADKKKQDQLKKQQAKEQLARDKVYDDNMRRLTGQASKTGSGGNGDAAKSTGNNRGDPSYVALIAARVRSNTVFSGDAGSGGNPTVEYRIDLLPDGSLRGPVRKQKSSGVPAFDQAVENAIEKSLPFPRDKTGNVPSSILYIHKMKE